MKNVLTSQSRITSKYQTVIPKSIRQAIHLQENEDLVWSIVHTGDDPVILVSPKPKDWARYLSGLGKRVWKDIDSDAYLKKLKSEWRE